MRGAAAAPRRGDDAARRWCSISGRGDKDKTSRQIVKIKKIVKMKKTAPDPHPLDALSSTARRGAVAGRGGATMTTLLAGGRRTMAAARGRTTTTTAAARGRRTTAAARRRRRSWWWRRRTARRTGRGRDARRRGARWMPGRRRATGRRCCLGVFWIFSQEFDGRGSGEMFVGGAGSAPSFFGERGPT